MIVEHSARWLTTKTVAIEWTLNGATPTKSYAIVQRSEFPDSGFSDISTPVLPSGVMSFIDTAPPNISELGTYYYKVEIRSTEDDSVLKASTVKHPRRDRPKVALEIVRRNNLLLRRFSGLRGFLISKKESGTRCPNCWDPVKERRSKSKCSDCGDTGWFSGVSSPIPIFVSSSSPNETQGVSVLGATEEIQRQLWTSNFPLINPGDIIILDDKEIFRVDGVQPITFRETIVSQNLQTTSMSKNREYSDIPLPAFDEFTKLDLVHRQYGGISTEDHTEYKDLTPRLGDFSIRKEGTKK